MRFLLGVACAVGLLLGPAPLLAQKNKTKADEAAPQQEGPPQPVMPVVDINTLDPGLYALINTSVGQMTALLYEKQAPVTVRNFIALARGTQPWYDPKVKKVVTRPLYLNLIFHRVIPDFMIQTGDPTATGRHNCGFVLPDEFQTPFRFDRAGRLAMANAGPKTAACQFFITEAPYPDGNGKFTIFGQLVDGLPLVSRIAHVIRDPDDKPHIPTKLISITFLRIGPRAPQPPPAPPASPQ